MPSGARMRMKDYLQSEGYNSIEARYYILLRNIIVTFFPRLRPLFHYDRPLSLLYIFLTFIGVNFWLEHKVFLIAIEETQKKL